MKEIQDFVIKILEQSPQLAIWILVIIYTYKVIFIGSIFALVRFVVKTWADSFRHDKEHELRMQAEKMNKPEKWEVTQGLVINDGVTKDALLSLLLSFRSGSSSYIHLSDLDRVKKWIKEGQKADPKILS